MIAVAAIIPRSIFLHRHSKHIIAMNTQNSSIMIMFSANALSL